MIHCCPSHLYVIYVVMRQLQSVSSLLLSDLLSEKLRNIRTDEKTKFSPLCSPVQRAMALRCLALQQRSVISRVGRRESPPLGLHEIKYSHNYFNKSSLKVSCCNIRFCIMGTNFSSIVKHSFGLCLLPLVTLCCACCH